MSSLQTLLDRGIYGVLAPVVVASFLGCALCGIVLSLAVIYFGRFPQDRPAFKAMVAFLTGLAILDSAVQASWAYRLAVTEFSQPLKLLQWPWQYTAFIFLWRSWIISGRKSYVITLCQSALCCGSLGCVLYFGYWGSQKTTLSGFNEGSPAVWAWLGTGLATDVFVTASIVWYMVVKPKKARGSSIVHTSSPLMRIVMQSFQANFVALLVHTILLGLMGYSFKSWSMHYVIPAFCTSKVYIGSVITALNARRTSTDGTSLSTSGEASRTKGLGARPFTGRGTATHNSVMVTVEEDVNVDEGAETELGSLKSPARKTYAVEFALEKEASELEKGAY